MFASTFLIKNAYIKSRLFGSLAPQFTDDDVVGTNLTSHASSSSSFEDSFVDGSALLPPLLPPPLNSINNNRLNTAHDAYEDYYGPFSNSGSRPTSDDNTTTIGQHDDRPLPTSSFNRYNESVHQQHIISTSEATPHTSDNSKYFLPSTTFLYGTTTSTAASLWHPAATGVVGGGSNNNNNVSSFSSSFATSTFLPTNITDAVFESSTESAASITTSTLEWVALFLVIFPLATIFGNTLVILAVNRNQSLQNATNYFIVSLACADVLVASIVMPFAIYIVTFTNMVWTLGFMVCDMWIAADVIASTASILNLVAIAVDRYMAVRMPIKYAQQLRTRRIAITIFLVWTISILIGIPIMAGFNTPPDGQVRPENDCAFYNADYILMSGFISFWVPTVLLFIIYWYVFSTLKRRSSAMRAKMQHQSNTTNTTITNTAKPSAAFSQAKSLPQPTSTTPAVRAAAPLNTATKPSAAAVSAKLPSSTTPTATTTTTTTTSSAASAASAPAAAPANLPDDRLDAQHTQQSVVIARVNSGKSPPLLLTSACPPTLAITTITTNNNSSSSSGTTTTTTANNTLISNKSSTASSSDLVVLSQQQANENVRPTSAATKTELAGESVTNTTLLLSNFPASSLHRPKLSKHKQNIRLHSNVLPTSPVWVQRLDECEQARSLKQEFCDNAAHAFLDTAFHVEHVEGPNMIAAASFGYEISTLPRRHRPGSMKHNFSTPLTTTVLSKSQSSYAVELNCHHRPQSQQQHGIDFAKTHRNFISYDDDEHKATLTAVHVDEFAATQQVILSSAHEPRRNKAMNTAAAVALVASSLHNQTLLLPASNLEAVPCLSANHLSPSEPAAVGKQQRALSWQFPPATCESEATFSKGTDFQLSVIPNNDRNHVNDTHADSYAVHVIDTNNYPPSGRAARLMHWLRSRYSNFTGRTKLTHSNPSSSSTTEEDNDAASRRRSGQRELQNSSGRFQLFANMKRLVMRRGTLGASSRDRDSSSDQQMSRVGVNGLVAADEDYADDDAGSSHTRTRRESEAGGNLLRKSESLQSAMLPSVAIAGNLAEHSSSSTSWFGLSIGGQKSTSNHVNKTHSPAKAGGLHHHRLSTVSLDNLTSVAALAVGATVGTAVGLPGSGGVGGAKRALPGATTHQQQQQQQRQHMAAVKNGRRKATARRERKATATMAVVLAIYLICWIPFFALHTLNAICMKLEPDGTRRENMWCSPSYTAFMATTWIGYGNSFINPVIYSVFNPDFRRAFRQLLSFR